MRVECRRLRKGVRVLAGTKQNAFSEFTETFERVEFGDKLLPPFESESLFSSPPLQPIIKIVLIKNDKVFRFNAWCEDGERYRLYTRDFERYSAAISEYTNGQVNITEKVWGCGYYITLLGPHFTLPDTPSCVAFENEILATVSSSFDAAIDSEIYGLCESELFQAKATVEFAIRNLEKARQRFTPLRS